MTADLDLGIEIVGVPTVREGDGLAMSSRNVRLTPDHRQAAVVVPRALTATADLHRDGMRDAAVLRAAALRVIASEPLARLEYVEIVDASTLVAVDRTDDPSVVLTAVWFGDVRLIDNRLLD